MSRSVLFLVTFLLFLFSYTHHYSQNTNELGIPFIQNFGPRDYNSRKTSFGSIFQDKRGFMYFSSDYSVLHYDGVNWNTFFGSNQFQIKKIVQGNDDELYFITQNSLGKIEIGEDNWPYLKDLSFKIPKKIRPINKMLDCINHLGEIYIFSDKNIFILSNDQIKAISTDKNIKKSFYHNNRIYVIQEEIGLTVIENNILKPISGTFFLNDNIQGALTGKANDVIAYTKQGSIYSYKEGKAKLLFSIPINYKLNTQTKNPVLQLNDREFVISIQENGILHCDNEGNIIQMINSQNGIKSNKISSMFLDNSNALWVSHSEGISRIEIDSNITLFDSKSFGLENIEDVKRFNDQLYFATSSGLFVSRKDSVFYGGLNKVKRISNSDVKIYQLTTIGNTFFATSNQGVYIIDNNKMISLSDEPFKATVITKSRQGDWSYVGTENGIRIMTKDQKNTWNLSEEIYLDNASTTYIEEGDKNDLWINNSNPGYIKVDIQYNEQKEPVIDSANANQYFPKIKNLAVSVEKFFRLKNKLIFTGYEQLLMFDYDKNELVPYPLFNNNFFVGQYEHLQYYPADIFLNNDQVYYGTNFMPHLIIKGKYNKSLNKISFEKSVFSKIKVNGYPSDIFFDQDSIIWFMDNTLYRIDKKKISNPSKKFKTYISEVLIDKDSTISNVFQQQKTVKLPDTTRAIKFKFGAPTYHGVKNTKFKFYLEGYDKGLQPYFIYDNQKKYENLDPGTYTFHVIAKNQEQIIGEEATFTFVILPPWYQTWWAYTCYAVLLALFVWGVVKWRTRQILKKNAALEITIAQRTEQLAEKNERLKNLDEAKSKFFTNVSHEFRTPLTLIKGLTESMLKNDTTNYNYKVIHRNTKRLNDLINQLLDIAKLESGEMSLSVTPGDISTFIRTLVSSFSSLANVKKIKYQFDIQTIEQLTWFDKDKLEKIILNLISNAFKFTPENESIQCSAYLLKDKPGYLQFIVQDTGIGISEDKLPYLFERFYQVNTSETREQEGTGIGLSLVKELITLYNGEIEVKSMLRQGTKCIVTLPIQKSLFNQNDICKETIAEETDDFQIPYILEESHPNEDIKTNAEKIILLVEDNTDLRKYIKDGITKEFEIIEAENGAIGLEQAMKHIPDIVITDIMMPKMNGEELCQKLKKDPKTNHIPIIMLTAKADQKSKIDGFNMGADAYISKPFNAEELNVRIHNLVTIREKLKQKYQKSIVVNPSEVITENQDERFLQKISSLIQENINNPELGVEFLTSNLHMSRTQLHRKLKALTGLSTTEFIRSIRLKRAAQLLEKNVDSITQIGYQVGFSDHSYFTKCFKKQYGIPPSEYTSSKRSE